MEDVAHVQSFEGLDHFDEDLPDVLLLYVAVALLVFDNFLVKVAIVEIVHDDAEAGCRVFEKCFFVTDDAPMSKRHAKAG